MSFCRDEQIVPVNTFDFSSLITITGVPVLGTTGVSGATSEGVYDPWCLNIKSFSQCNPNHHKHYRRYDGLVARNPHTAEEDKGK